MARHSMIATVACALVASTAAAQQPQAQAQAQTQAQQPQAPMQANPAVVPVPAAPTAQEGFFRPAPDPALTRFPDASPAVTSPVPAIEAAVLQQQRDRQALELELERSRIENARAQEAQARAAPPMIVSPLDGTAPIVSPIGR